jgi:hypothetical protein
MKLRHKRGGTLGLVAAVALMLVFVGFCIYWVAQILGGGKQVANATDAGAITAAKELEAVTINVTSTPGLIGNPIELEGLAVDTTSGAPNPNSNAYNIYAYNRAVGAAMLMCANAEAEGTSAAIANAQTIVTNLQAIGNYLNQALNTQLASPNQVFNAFQSTAYSNNVNMMGPGAGSIATVQNIVPGWVGSTDLAGNQTGKSNVYFNQYVTSSFIGPYLPTFPATGNVVSNTAASYSASLSGSESGQPFIPGYTKIDYSNGVGGGPPIPGAVFYAVAVNPDQFPHLVDINRFANGTTAPDGKPVATTNVPFNSVQGSTQTQETSKTNMFASALASAVIGTSNNMYPASLSHGFVLVTNDHCYKYNAVQQDGASAIANPPTLDEWPPGATNSNIFNAELYEDTAAGGGGAIDTYTSMTAPGGEVFGVEAGPTYDASYPNLAQQMATWWSPYLASNASNTTYTGPNTPYVDKYGHDPNLDPTGGVNGWNPAWPQPPSTIPTNEWVKSGNLWVQNNNARVAPPGAAAPPGTQYIVQATADNMATITGPDVSCHDSVYAGTPPNNCINAGAGATHLTDFENSFGDTTPSGMTVTGDGGATGGLTSLEYLKGLVITAYENMIQTTGYNKYFTATIPSPQYQYPPAMSGSHIYSRSGIPYAQPTNSATIEFGTTGTPYQLLNQIVDGSSDAAYAANSTLASCPGNIDLTAGSGLWNQSGSIQGQLLQRVSELDPTYNSTKLTNLLNTAGTQIDLGWSDVIYWDTTSNAVVMQPYNPSNPGSLASFPTWLQGQLTAILGASSPAAFLDGTATPMCADEPWNAAISNNQVNGQIGVNGNIKGDLDLHDMPFMVENGTINTQDGVVWTSNSGKGGLLGQLLFQQNTNAGGTAGTSASTFSGPN